MADNDLSNPYNVIRAMLDLAETLKEAGNTKAESVLINSTERIMYDYRESVEELNESKVTYKPN